MRLRRTFNHYAATDKAGFTRPSLRNSHVFKSFPGVPADKGAIVTSSGKVLVVEPVELDPKDEEGPLSPNVVRLAKQVSVGEKLPDDKMELRLRKKYITVNRKMAVKREGEKAPVNMAEVATVSQNATGTKTVFRLTTKLLRSIMDSFEKSSDDGLLFEVQDGYSPVKIVNEKSGAYAILMPRR